MGVSERIPKGGGSMSQQQHFGEGESEGELNRLAAREPVALAASALVAASSNL